ncbi:MAG TPA: hypothetical protein ENH56_13625 [Roseobacter sp.]|uniref:Uncharacterized protein n=1 Tax=marine sediment metagenome TaxID=412755 RepID=A0A0F9T3S3_9ZZZZ|nr:hypothetical protein [Roseobacter sp.]HEC71304.1 hypothetical protein [Roseobacter sp.]
MKLWLLFIAVFIGGPLIFRLLIRRPPSPRLARGLAVLALISAIIAMILRYGFAGQWGDDLAITVVGLFFIWLGWISVIAFAVQAIRHANPGTNMRRATGILGAAATTIPWFGLALALYLAA